ncbi:monocarboxylate transporter 12-like [Pecten maximus]|uniref:monocarboxylate transporter 12-like n=1 Tax=Pecten maximus TaxID=6579 RepID=UPI0014586A2A|nr:monocarboxylate transporter 12-like [Pecten maximus]
MTIHINFHPRIISEVIIIECSLKLYTTSVSLITTQQKMSPPRHLKDTPMDSGYSWIILMASAGIYMLLGGTAKAYSIFYTEFLLYYGTGSGNTAWIGSVNSFLFFAMGPLANRLSEVFTFRRVVLLGGLLHGIGVFASAFMPYMELHYITIGLISGVGGGLAFTPANTIVSFYFERRRALANSIMISIAGLGSFLFPYVNRFLIDRYGIHGALMIIGGFLTHNCAFALLLRQPSQLINKFRKSNALDNAENIRNNTDASVASQEGVIENNVNTDKLLECNETHVEMKIDHTKDKKNRPSLSISNLFNFSLFRNQRFAMYAMAYTVNTFAYIGIYSTLPAHIISLGLGKEKVVTALSITGAMEIASKLFFGWIVDIKIMSVKKLLLITFIVSAIASLAIPFFENFIAIAVYAGIVGVFPGSYFTLMAVVLLQCIPLTDLTSGFGLTFLCLSFGAVLCQPIAGWIEDGTGTWDASFWFLGGMSCLATLIVLCEPLFVKHWFLRVKPKNSINTKKPEMTSDLKDSGTLDRRYSLELVTRSDKDYNTAL